MIKETINEMRCKSFPNTYLSNLYFGECKSNGLLIMSGLDKDINIYTDIISHISSDFMFLLPTPLMIGERPYKNYVEAINKLELLYGGTIDLNNYVHNKPEYEEMIEKGVDVQMFYRGIDTEETNSYKELIEFCMSYSWVIHSPLLVNFEEKLIVGFFEWGLKILMVDEDKKKMIENTYKHFIDTRASI